MATSQLRNSIHGSLQRCGLLLASLLLTCLALPQKTQGFVPAPNGGYPGFNTAGGTNALQSLTTGVGNAAIGWYSLFSNTDGSFNTAVGAGTLIFNTGDQIRSRNHTAVGTAALLFNTTGFETQPPALRRSTATLSVPLTRLSVLTRFQATPTASTIRPLGVCPLRRQRTGFSNTATGVFALQVTPPAFGTRLWVTVRALSSPPATAMSVSAPVSLVLPARAILPGSAMSAPRFVWRHAVVMPGTVNGDRQTRLCFLFAPLQGTN